MGVPCTVKISTGKDGDFELEGYIRALINLEENENKSKREKKKKIDKRYLHFLHLIILCTVQVCDTVL